MTHEERQGVQAVRARMQKQRHQFEWEKTLERVKATYRSNGYWYEQDFPGEYLLMLNESTGERVRLYYNGRVVESGGEKWER